VHLFRFTLMAFPSCLRQRDTQHPIEFLWAVTAAPVQ
jgi:hypothetical protein